MTQVEGSLYLLVVDGDGKIDVVSPKEVTIDWRYDPKTELWTDTNGNPTDTAGEP